MVALVDIDALKKTEREIKAARDYAEAILRTTRDPLVVLRADLTVDSANDAFYKTFKLKPAETEGRLIYERAAPVGHPGCAGCSKRSSARQSLQRLRDHTSSGLGKRTLLLNARRLDNPKAARSASSSASKT